MDDPYLARIWAKHVTPPRTVISLKRWLSAVEGIDDYKSVKLFMSSKIETPMDNESYISFTPNSGPGSKPDDPMVVLCEVSGTRDEMHTSARPEAILLPPREGKSPFQARFRKRFLLLLRGFY